MKKKLEKSVSDREEAAVRVKDQVHTTQRDIESGASPAPGLCG